MKNYLRQFIKHFIVFTLVSLGMLLVVYVSGMFVTLHPDAYIDAFMSVLYVYAFIVVIHLLFHIIKITTNINPLSVSNKAFNKYKNIGIFTNIAIIFTLITVINSLMMITGYDTPKTGSFAYLHLLARTLIIVLGVSITMYKDVMKSLKNLKSRAIHSKKERQTKRSAKLNRLRQNFSQKPFESSAILFTLITVTGCVIMVTFSLYLKPKGGSNLYLALIVFYGILSTTTLGFNVTRKFKAKKATQ